MPDKASWYPLYPDSFLADTMGLPPRATQLYLHLLVIGYSQDGVVTLDPRTLRNIGSELDDPDLTEVLATFWEPVPGEGSPSYSQPRMLQEIEKARSRTERQREGGRKGVQTRWQKYRDRDRSDIRAERKRQKKSIDSDLKVSISSENCSNNISLESNSLPIGNLYPTYSLPIGKLYPNKCLKNKGLNGHDKDQVDWVESGTDLALKSKNSKSKNKKKNEEEEIRIMPKKVQKVNSKQKSARKRDPRFTELWNAYACKIACVSAERAYAKINPSADLHSRLVKTAKRWAECTCKTNDRALMAQGWHPRPYLSTWLNQERYDDEVLPTPPASRSKQTEAQEPKRVRYLNAK